MVASISGSSSGERTPITRSCSSCPVAQADYQKQIPELKLPVYFATGRYDLSDMAVLTERYYQALKNTQKHLVWFEASGHAPIYEQTPEFLNFMVNTILANTGR